ncbi:MAG: hypothetical protein K2L14_01380 [Duncaniella sp.]|nr:hypothetical protein [Duncaniella sp.]
MKKFYTLLSAAIAGTMMLSAGARVTDIKNVSLEAKQLNDLKTFSTEKVEVVKKAQAYKAPAKAEAVAAEDLNGEYIFKAYARNFDYNAADPNTLPSAYWMNESVSYIEIAEDNSVYIENLWYTNTLTGVYDPAAGTITIDRTQTFPVRTQSGQTETCFYVINFKTMAASDLVLTVDAEKRMLSWTPADDGESYLETLLIGAPTYNGNQIFDQMFDCTLNMINCVAYSWLMDDNGAFVTGDDGQPESTAYFSYATVDHTAGTLSIENFLDFNPYVGEEGSFGNSIVFNIDKDAQTVSAVGQNIPFQISATEWLPFELNGIDLEGEGENADFVLTEDFIMMGDEMALESGAIVTDLQNSGVGAAMYADYNGRVIGQEFFMVEYVIYDAVFSGTDDSGIADVVVDNNENAPVEYFNLQGVRVENPAAGLYIRRQGNKSTKVLVK